MPSGAPIRVSLAGSRAALLVTAPLLLKASLTYKF